MKAFTTPLCCCFDLEIGGLILGYLGTLFWTISFFIGIKNPISWGFTITTILLAMSIGWVYGIHKNKHAYMLPDLIAQFIGLVVSIICLVVFTILAMIGAEFIASIIPNIPNIDPNTKHQIDGGQSILATILFGIWLCLATSTSIQWYFTAVKYSLYMKMKAAAEGLDWFASGNSV